MPPLRPPINRPSVPSALAESASSVGLSLTDPRTGGRIFNGPELLDYLAKRAAGGATPDALAYELQRLGFGPNDAAQILQLATGWTPGGQSVVPSMQGPTAAPSPAASTPTGGSAASSTQPTPAQGPTTATADGGRYAPPPRSGAGVIQSLIAGAPAGIRPLPEQVGRGWAAALPQLGAAIGNMFGGAALAQQQQFEKEQATAAEARAKTAEERAAAESKQRMEATRFEMGAEQTKLSRFADEQFGRLTPQQAIELAKQGVSKVSFSMAVANQDWASAQRILGMLPTTTEMDRQRREAGFQAAGLDPSLAEIYDSPYQARQDAIAKLGLARAQKDLDDINAGRVPEEAKPGLLQAYTREIGDIDAQITGLTPELAKAKAAEAYMAKLKESNPEQYKAMQAYMQGPEFDSSVVESRIESLKTSRTVKETAIKALYPGQKFEFQAPDTTATPPTFDPEAFKKRLDEIFLGAKSGAPSLSPEDEAIAKRASAARTDFSAVGSIARGVMAPFQAAAGAVIEPISRIQAALGSFDRDPAYIDMFKKVEQQVKADAQAGNPYAAKLTDAELARITIDAYVMAINPGTVGAAAPYTGSPNFFTMSPEDRAVYYQQIVPFETLKAIRGQPLPASKP